MQIGNHTCRVFSGTILQVMLSPCKQIMARKRKEAANDCKPSTPYYYSLSSKSFDAKNFVIEQFLKMTTIGNT